MLVSWVRLNCCFGFDCKRKAPVGLLFNMNAIRIIMLRQL